MLCKLWPGGLTICDSNRRKNLNLEGGKNEEKEMAGVRNLNLEGGKNEENAMTGVSGWLKLRIKGFCLS